MDAEHWQWRPQVFDATRTADATELARLQASGVVRRQCDELLTQLRGLLICREPAAALKDHPEALEARVEAHLGDVDVGQYGRWVYYAWSGALVHLLPPLEFMELRTARNRYKIDDAQQALLRTKRIGVVGLSVGRASVVTMALEGVGGHFRLADFDHLELSNLNRLRCGVADLGINKAVLAARELFEIDPYLDVAVLEDGVTEDNLDVFLCGHGGNLDLLVEECDELSVKLRLRERCRSLGIPVVMETSDRGLIDIERFDHDRDRPLFHGLVGDVDAASVRGLSDQDKVPFALRVLGVNAMSTRLAASLVEIGESITGWPQLASAVALGGGVVGDTARRILLDELTCSGRFYVDLDCLISPEAAVEIVPHQEDTGPRLDPERPPPLRRAASDALTPEVIRTIVAYGIQAPSGGNNQAWRFSYDGGELHCWIDPKHVQEFLEFNRTGSTLSVGCAVENMVLAAQELGLKTEVSFAPRGPESDLVCSLRFAFARALDPDPLARLITRRCTTRARGPGDKLRPDHARDFVAAAQASGATLQLLSDDDALVPLGHVLGASDRLAMQHPRIHGELMGDLRWTREEMALRNDGLDVETLDVREFEKAAMRVVSRWPVMALLRDIGGGGALETASRRAVHQSAAMGLLTVPGTDARAYFDGGRAMQRVWLTITQRGVAMQPMTVLPAMLARLTRGAGEGLPAWHCKQLMALRETFDALFPRPADAADIMLFRLTYAPQETRRSARRPLADVFRTGRA